MSFIGFQYYWFAPKGRRVVPIEEAVARIRVAAEARHSPDFLIVARTDAFGSLGLDEAIRRGREFADAGADILFVCPHGVGDKSDFATLQKMSRKYFGLLGPLQTSPDAKQIMTGVKKILLLWLH